MRPVDIVSFFWYVSYSFEVDGAEEVLLLLPKAEQVVFHERPEPLPRLHRRLHEQGNAQSDHHVQDQIARPHGIDHPDLLRAQQKHVARFVDTSNERGHIQRHNTWYSITSLLLGIIAPILRGVNF